MTYSIDELNALDTAHILHPATSVVALEQSQPIIMDSAKDVFIKDKQGRELLDGIAGLWCSNLGHGRTELAEVMAKATIELDYFHTFNAHSNEAQILLSEKLIELAPEGLSHVFYGLSGSDANDTLIKIAWQYHAVRGKPQKRKVISRWQAYHGTSISTASLTGLPAFHKAYHMPLDFVLHTANPHYYSQAKSGESETEFTARLLTELETLIAQEGVDNIAAFIGEPIMGAGGIIEPPVGYWEGVQRICRAHDILLIADEVVCGYGRTGKNFGSMQYDIQPDMMATAKGITAGVFPLSAAFISKDVHDVMRQASAELGSFFHGYTYSGHPVGAAVALETLRIMEVEKVTENAATMGAYMHQRLQETMGQHPQVGEIRGKGLLASIQFMKDVENQVFFEPADKVGARASAACMEQGLIARPMPTVSSLALSPPLTITKSEVDLIIERMEKALMGLRF